MGAISSAADRYFERVLGLPLSPGGGVVRTSLRLRGHPPFLLASRRASLVRDGQTYLSLAPDEPLEDISRCESLHVLVPGEALPAPREAAVALSAHDTVFGASRIPPNGLTVGIRRRGRIVSWACAASVGEVWNITLETHPTYRRRGFARDCLIALTGELLRRGYAPLYLCSVDNPSSLRTALSAGYREYGVISRTITP